MSLSLLLRIASGLLVAIFAYAWLETVFEEMTEKYEAKALIKRDRAESERTEERLLRAFSRDMQREADIGAQMMEEDRMLLGRKFLLPKERKHA